MDKGGNSNLNIPNAPGFPQEYTQGTNTYLGHLPRYQNTEMASRENPSYGDTARIGWQQFLQQQFGPTQYGQQLSALGQLDPTGSADRTAAGSMIGSELAGNLNPGMQDMIRRSEAARGNVYGQAAVTGEAMNSEQMALGNEMQFQNSATPEQWMNFISPVSADRSMAYVNPNAGFLGVNALNQQFANQLGAAGAQAQPSSNPWGSILGTAATVAPLLIGAFSDPRLKSNVRKVGRAPSGHNLYEYDITPPKRHEIGVMADEVAATHPDAVATDPVSGYMKVMYPALGMSGPVQVSA